MAKIKLKDLNFYENYVINNIVMIDLSYDVAILKVSVKELLPELDNPIMGFEQKVRGANLRSMMCGTSFDKQELTATERKQVAKLKNHIKLYFINLVTKYYE